MQFESIICDGVTLFLKRADSAAISPAFPFPNSKRTIHWRRLFYTVIHGVLFVLFPHQEHLVEPVRKALNYYTHMGKTMEEELKKEQVKKHSREENEKVTTFSFPTDNNSPSKGDVTRDDSQWRFLAQHSVATLLQRCFEWLQHRSSTATMCCPKNRRCESSRVTSP